MFQRIIRKLSGHHDGILSNTPPDDSSSHNRSQSAIDRANYRSDLNIVSNRRKNSNLGDTITKTSNDFSPLTVNSAISSAISSIKSPSNGSSPITNPSDFNTIDPNKLSSESFYADQLSLVIDILKSIDLPSSPPPPLLSDDETTEEKIDRSIGLLEAIRDEILTSNFDRQMQLNISDLRKNLSETGETSDVAVLDWISTDYMKKERSSLMTPAAAGTALRFITRVRGLSEGKKKLEKKSNDFHMNSTNNSANNSVDLTGIPMITEEASDESGLASISRRSNDRIRHSRTSSTLLNIEQDAGRSFSSIVITPHYQKLLSDADKWTFNVFEFEEVAKERTLTALMFFLFDRLNIFNSFSIDRNIFFNFITTIEDGYLPYKDVPYHNHLHASDVVQTVYTFMAQSPQFLAKISTMDVLSLLLSSAVHDFRHPGTNNAYQTSIQSELSIIYNDRSVLENMHISETFKILRDPTCNIFGKMSAEMKKEIRSSMISLVLATDMQQHFSMLAEFKGEIDKKKVKETDFDVSIPRDRLLCSEIALHCADIGNPAKPRDVYLKFTDRVLEEFWRQGDREKADGMTVSAMCDRTKPNTEKSQIGFIDVIVKPLYECFAFVCPQGAQLGLQCLEENRSYWNKKLEQDEKTAAAAAAAASPSTDGSNQGNNSSPAPVKRNEAKRTTLSIAAIMPSLMTPPRQSSLRRTQTSAGKRPPIIPPPNIPPIPMPLRSQSDSNHINNKEALFSKVDHSLKNVHSLSQDSSTTDIRNEKIAEEETSVPLVLDDEIVGLSHSTPSSRTTSPDSSPTLSARNPLSTFPLSLKSPASAPNSARQKLPRQPTPPLVVSASPPLVPARLVQIIPSPPLAALPPRPVTLPPLLNNNNNNNNNGSRASSPLPSKSEDF